MDPLGRALQGSDLFAALRHDRGSRDRELWEEGRDGIAKFVANYGRPTGVYPLEL